MPDKRLQTPEEVVIKRNLRDLRMHFVLGTSKRKLGAVRHQAILKYLAGDHDSKTWKVAKFRAVQQLKQLVPANLL